MKKVIPALVVLMMLAVLIPAVAMAWGENSGFSQDEWAEIAQVAWDSYPNAKIEICSQYRPRLIIVKVTTADPEWIIRLDVLPIKAKVSVDLGGRKDTALAAEKIRARIQSILNRPPSIALGRDLLERQGVE